MATATYGAGIYGTDVYGVAPDPPVADASLTVRVREKPPLRLTVGVETPSGRSFVWNEQDPRPENVPNGLTFSSIAPGGFDHAGLTLPRKPNQAAPDLERLSTVQIKGVGGDIAWEGRLERSPRSSGDQFQVAPDCSGYQSVLADRSDIRVVYVDRDLGRWQGPSASRQLAYLATYDTIQAAGTDTDSRTGPSLGLPVLGLTINPASTAQLNAVEGWYDGVDEVESVYYEYQVTNGDVAKLELQVGVADDDEATGFVGSGDLYGSASGSGTFTPATAKRWLLWQWLNGTGFATGISQDRVVQLSNLAVFGNNGLTKRGAAPDQGFWASDVIAHAVGKWTQLTPDVDDSGFVIGQLAFTDPTTVAEIVTQANRFHLYDWMVWENQTFVYHPRGARGRSWRGRLSPTQLEETGPQIDRLYSDVVVQYTDVDGTTRTVGFPGSNADATDAVLHDDDPDNPANQLGITRASLLQMSTATLAEATEVGRRFLQEQKLLDTSGQAKLVGHVQDDRGVWHPAWRVRAGDTISFVDASDRSERRITQASYDHSTRTADITLDSPPEGLAAILERLGAALVPLGLS